MNAKPKDIAMRTVATLAAWTVALLMAACLAAPAWAAQGPDQASGQTRDALRKGLRDIPKDRRGQARALLNEFKADTAAGNAQLEAKLRELDALFQGQDPNETRIRTLADEILTLRAQAYKKLIEFRISFYKEFGVLPF